MWNGSSSSSREDVIRIIRIEKNLPKKKGFVPNSAANLIFHKQSKIVFMSSKLGYINWIRVRSRKEMQRSNRVYVLQTNLGRSWSHSSKLYEDSRHFISKEDKKPHVRHLIRKAIFVMPRKCFSKCWFLLKICTNPFSDVDFLWTAKSRIFRWLGTSRFFCLGEQRVALLFSLF